MLTRMKKSECRNIWLCNKPFPPFQFIPLGNDAMNQSTCTTESPSWNRGGQLVLQLSRAPRVLVP